MIYEHEDEDDRYIFVTFTPQEERLMERLVNVIYYGTSILFIIVGLVYLSQRPFKK